MQCSKCLSNNPDGARFCTQCGAPLQSQPQPHQDCCPSCGSPVSPGARFCTVCGRPFDVLPKSSDQSSAVGRPQQSADNTVANHSTSGHHASDHSVVDLPPQPESRPEPQSGAGGGFKRHLWWIILLAVAITGGAIALILSSSGTSLDGEQLYDSEPDSDIWSCEEIGYEEPVDSIVAESNELETINGEFTVSGDWGSTTVEMTIHFTVDYDASITATGVAKYGGSDVLVYNLEGSGFDGDESATLRLHEYDADGDFTGSWDGAVTMKNGSVIFSGTFYDENGNSYTQFTLSDSK